MPILTVKDYSKKRQVAERSVRQFLADGTIPPSAVLRQGGRVFIDSVKADRALKANIAFTRQELLAKTQPSEIPSAEGSKALPLQKGQKKAIEKAGTGNRTYSEARTETARYKAALLKLDLEVRQGRMVDAEQVKTAAFNRGRAVRDALLNVPDRLASILAAEHDAKKIESILRTEITAALEELADDVVAT
jgi:hypothetical protein